MGNASSRLTKVMVILAAGMSGATLAGAFGVQSGMQKLSRLASPLGEELREVERLRLLLRRRGALDDGNAFQGEAAETTRAHLTRTLIHL